MTLISCLDSDRGARDEETLPSLFDLIGQARRPRHGDGREEGGAGVGKGRLLGSSGCFGDMGWRTQGFGHPILGGLRCLLLGTHRSWERDPCLELG